MKNKIPESIIKVYGECGACGSITCIDHLLNFDKKTRKKLEQVLGKGLGWVVFCEECESIGVVNE